MAAVDDPSGFPGAAALRPQLRRRRQRAPPADHDPPRAVRLDRAFFRDPARALRGGVPRLARAGAGDGVARRRPSRRVRVPSRGSAARRGIPGRAGRRHHRLARRPRPASQAREGAVRPRGRRRGRRLRDGRRESAGERRSRTRRPGRRLRRPARGRGRRAAMSLERLWAGWRAAYVASAAMTPSTGPDDCLFCALAAAPDGESLVAARDDLAFAVMNAFPYTSGHLMIAPLRHEAELEDLKPDEATAVMTLTQQAVAALKAAYTPDGINVGVNLGRPAGAGVPGHVHLHALPRWNGDTNFMTTVAETRVLPEDLRTSWEKLRAAWPKT